ncbi:uncharacterized protein LOC131632950 [Vicia villosa]|uniref:uncharacterized protein LOC131632950 n=1 Tax=Vicia villosa TaxID=3911 RepID=UPI00273C5386|nr:uncharacterized protein LOC131632950 [Vicia villosa]
MDFVLGLPRTPSNCEAIWVIVDRLTKFAHFIPIRMNYLMERFAKLYVEKIVSLHDIPSSIVYDRDMSFHSSIRMAPFEALNGRKCKTHLCWYESGKSVMVGLEIVKQTTEKIKIIQEKMEASHSRQKSCHDKRRKEHEFEVGDHVFLRVTLVTSGGRALKSRKLMLHFISPYQISERVGEVAHWIALSLSLANLHDVFHVSQFRRYIANPSHVVQSDDVQVRDDLTVETSPMWIED